MDYEAGRSDAHPTTKRLLALALGVSVDDLEAAPFATLRVPAHQAVAVNSPLPCAPPYKTGIFSIENPEEYFGRARRLRVAA